MWSGRALFSDQDAHSTRSINSMVREKTKLRRRWRESVGFLFKISCGRHFVNAIIIMQLPSFPPWRFLSSFNSFFALQISEKSDWLLLKFFRLAAAKLRLAALSRDPFYLLANKGRFTRHVIIDQTKFDGELISAFFSAWTAHRHPFQGSCTALISRIAELWCSNRR